MSIELIAILCTAAFQFVGLIYMTRIARRAYRTGNLRNIMRLEEELRQLDDYVRTYSTEFDKFIAEFGKQTPRSSA
jgi:hypothetical protein